MRRFTAISVEVFLGVLQSEQKHIGKRREAKKVEMNIRQSETYRRLPGARYLVSSTIAPMCKSRYTVHFVAVDKKEYKDDRRSSNLREKMCKTYENVGEFLQITL